MWIVRDMKYIIPIIDLSNNSKYLIQSLLNIKTFRRHNKNDIILFDSSKRSELEQYIINITKRQLNYEYINQVYYDDEYFLTKKYQKISTNRHVAEIWAIKNLDSPFMISDSDIIWEGSIDFIKPLDASVDIVMWKWLKDGKTMLSDNLTIFNITENTKEFCSFKYIFWKGMLKCDNDDTSAFKKHVSRSGNIYNDNLILNSENCMEICSTIFKTINIQMLDNYVRDIKNKQYHYAKHRPERIEKITKILSVNDYGLSDLFEVDDICKIILS